MPRVLQVLGRSAGGIARHVGLLAASLDGVDGMIVDIAGPPDNPVRMPKPVIALDIPDGPLRGHRSAISSLRDLAGLYDVIHAHGLRAGIDAGIAGRRTGTPVLLTVHNLVRADVAGAVKAPLYRKAERLAVGATDHTFAVSQDIARHLRASMPRLADRIEVLYLGIGEAPDVGSSRSDMRAKLAMEDDDALIVSVARLAPQKSLDVLIDAVASMGSRPMVAVIGEGPLHGQLRDRVKDRGLEGRFHLLGFRDDAADWIAAADVFCLSSAWEGVPLAAQEAILLGTPVVATDVGGMRELIANKVSGRLVPPRDPVLLAAALEETLSGEDRARDYALAAEERLTERFSTAKMLDRLTEAYARA
jgi:glycosyltransferase involved in cell wall biosynthesis